METILTLDDTARLPVEPKADSDDPDRALLAAVAAGDGDALGDLVERHEARIYAVSCRLLGDREAARDVCQEVFLRAFQHAGRFKPRARVGTWLYRIAVNRCLNRLRRRRIVRFLRLESPADDMPRTGAAEPVAAEPLADRRLAAERRWQAVRARIAELPPGQRVVLVLARFEGLRYREIADALGITIGAVESRLVRAMRRLRPLEDDGR